MAMFGRKSRPPRRRTNQEAWMAIDGAFAARRCSVLDISAGGAKIRVEDPAFVTPVFQLKFSRADQGRRCKVTWQKGLVIGVEFCWPRHGMIASMIPEGILDVEVCDWRESRRADRRTYTISALQRVVAQSLRVPRLGETCKRSRRLIQKWRGAAAMTNIAAKKQPWRWGDRSSRGWSVRSWRLSPPAIPRAGSSRCLPSRAHDPANSLAWL